MRVRLFHYWTVLHASYWFIPSLMAVGAVVCSVLMIAVDRWLGPGWIEGVPWLYANKPDGARAVLSTIAGSMVTVAGVTFSITIAAVSYASSSFGPRILTNFMRDRGNQATLGTFIAAFLYCLLVLRTVRSADEAGLDEAAGAFVPHVAILFGLGLAVAGVGVLIYFIHHIPESIHLPNVVAHIGEDLRGHVDRRYPQRGQEAEAPGRAEEAALPDDFYDHVAPVRASATGYLENVDAGVLLKGAARHDLVVRLAYRPGDFATRGAELLYAYPADRLTDDVADELRGAFAWGNQRTQTRDVLFLVDELVEIAARALSPGVNDPFTAINCMDWLGSALIRFGQAPPPSAFRYDDAGQLRLVTRPVTFGDVAAACFGQLRPYAETDRNAALHLMATLAEVARRLPPGRYADVLAPYVEALRTGAARHLADDRDRALLEQRAHLALRLLHGTLEPARRVEAEPWLGGSA